MSEKINQAAPYSPFVSIDCVVFGFRNNQLQVLVLQYIGTDIWALPGGFIEANEDINDAAIRVLSVRTGLNDFFLVQFGVFGSVNRVDKLKRDQILNSAGLSKEMVAFFQNRFVSVGYYTIIDIEKAFIEKDNISQTLTWVPVDDVPQLMHDHNEILIKARKTLAGQLLEQPIGKNLMPKYFTMNELQVLHEAILGYKLTRTNFQRKMLSLGILERTEKRFTGKAHKAPFVYKFK
jgi:ADP-ribose pyrophosphatase YjhB (NUDIX family)